VTEPSSGEFTVRERALIDEARALVSPTAADAARVKGKLWATLGAGGTAFADGEPPLQKARGLALKQRVGLLAAGLGVGLVAGYELGQWVNTPTTAPASEVSAPVIQASHPDPGTATAVGASATTPAATSPTIGDPTSSDPRSAPHRDAGSLHMGAQRAPRTSHTPIDEVEWVQRVQRALAKGEPQLALALLRRLDEALPDGRLLEERRAADVLARCEISADGGRARAAAFAQDFARSVHLARIRAACGLEAKGE
jgi:hypothetical protein